MDKLLKIKEVAEILKVSQMTIIRRCRDGSLPFVQVGNLRRIREVDLEYFIIMQSRNTTKKKAPEPVYDGPPAELCGFEDNEEERMAELTEQRTKLGAMLKEKKVNEAPEPVRQPDAPYVGPYSSGFYQNTGIGTLLSAYGDDEDVE